MYPVIGLVGPARSGKDTFADILVRDHGFAKVAFADELRVAASKLDPIVGLRRSIRFSYESTEDDYWIRYNEAICTDGYEAAKDKYPELRRVLQQLGTEVIRDQDPEFWIRACLKTIDTLRRDQPVVVTDCRFHNELDAIMGITKGYSVRITRPGYLGLNGHISEQELLIAPTTFEVPNDGDFDQLARMAGIVARYVNQGTTRHA